MELTPQQKVANYYFRLRGWDWTDKKYKPIYARWVAVAKRDLLPLADGDPLVVKERIDEVKNWAERLNLSWTLNTVVNRWLEDHTIEKKPFTPEGDELKMIKGRWMISNWDGRLLDYPGSEKSIIWK